MICSHLQSRSQLKLYCKQAVTHKFSCSVVLLISKSLAYLLESFFFFSGKEGNLADVSYVWGEFANHRAATCTIVSSLKKKKKKIVLNPQQGSVGSPLL